MAAHQFQQLHQFAAERTVGPRLANADLITTCVGTEMLGLPNDYTVRIAAVTQSAIPSKTQLELTAPELLSFDLETGADFQEVSSEPKAN